MTKIYDECENPNDLKLSHGFAVEPASLNTYHDSNKRKHISESDKKKKEEKTKPT